MKKSGFIRVISNNYFICKYVFKYVPLYAIFKIIMQFMNAFIGVLTYIYSLKYMIDSVQMGRPFEEILKFLILLAIANIIIRLIDAFLEYAVTPLSKERLKQKLQLELFTNAVKMDLTCYDNPEFYNDFILAASQAEEQCYDIFNTIMELLNCISFILSLGAIILSVHYIGIIIALVTTVIALINSVNSNNLNNKKYLEIKPLERKQDYIKRVFYLSNYAKEIRIYDIKDELEGDFATVNKKIKSIISKYSNKLCFFSFFANYILNDFMMSTIYIIILLYQTAILKSITYGSFATMFYATNQLKDNLLKLSNIFAKFQSNSLYIEYFRKFLSYRPKIVQEQDGVVPPQTPSSIVLKQVDFHYEYSQKLVLRHIDLKINPGEKIAIIGFNGSGKTTLIKLILRLYDVTQGAILLNDTNIMNYRLMSYRDLFGVVFQDYQVYATSVAKNIAMDNNTDKKEVRENINKALTQSGISKVICQYPLGIDTAITKEFETNGAQFSGGEEQKLAISRIFYKDSSYIILDEPSSALDPISEYNLNQTIKSVLSDKTIIFITHRLSTTRNADKIFMMEDGAIIEEGTHDSLMNLDGKYAQMFHAQAEKYL